MEWGRYRLEMAETGANPAVSSLTFNAGYYGGGDADTPERLEISLDRKGYKPGDVATLTITSPAAWLFDSLTSAIASSGSRITSRA